MVEEAQALTGYSVVYLRRLARCGRIEAQPGDFDAMFRVTADRGGLEGWLDQCTAGGGVDVLATIVKGGDVCPTCGGKGKVRYSFLLETCPTCGGMGALAADDKVCTCSEPGTLAALAGDHAPWCAAVNP